MEPDITILENLARSDSCSVNDQIHHDLEPSRQP